MTVSYPNSIKTFDNLVDDVDNILASHQNEPNAEITAIETELGINPKGSYTDVAERLDVIEASGTDENAIHDNTSGEISAITEKTSITANDLFLY